MLPLNPYVQELHDVGAVKTTPPELPRIPPLDGVLLHQLWQRRACLLERCLVRENKLPSSRVQARQEGRVTRIPGAGYLCQVDRAALRGICAD